MGRRSRSLPDAGREHRRSRRGAPPVTEPVEPLRLTYEVRCSPEHAFRTWTERFGTWWPKGHSVSGDPEAVVLEARPGGRIYERTTAGDEVQWGEITAWEPPRSLSYLWHIRRDRADATDVRIDFVSDGQGGARIEVTHTGWERLGAEAQTWRDANAGGWDSLIPHFAEIVQHSPEPPLGRAEEQT
ncbi:hypothetical protein B7486_59250 [cyanobacterium TDX16]|nr:hypothetical protein B7486_59250 [cyanobacterium TDX16]